MSDKQERAIQAKNLIEVGLFAETLVKAEAAYLEKWRAAKTTQEREDYHRLITLMDRLKADLKSIIITGDIDAAAQAEADKPRSE